MNLSDAGLELLQNENTQVRQNYEHLVSTALGSSRKIFQDFFTHTNSWLENSVQTVTKTHYQTVNTSYIDYLGETSLSQNLLLYHASKNLPQKLLVKILMEKMKSLKNSPALKSTEAIKQRRTK